MKNFSSDMELVNNRTLLQIDKEHLLRMSNIEKLRYVSHLTVTYPLMNKILLQIDECQNSSQYSKEPECLSLIGPTRAGKSTIIEEHLKKYPDIFGQECVTKQILYCIIPCPAYIGGLAPSLLDALGDPFYGKDKNITRSTLRLYKLLEKCKVKMILLDEVQHLVDRNRQTLIKDSSDWFKNLIQDTGIPVVFAGLPESRKIFEGNEQLDSRVRNRFQIDAFDYKDKSFRVILHCFDSYLPFKYKAGLSEPDIWPRIFFATKGLMGFIKVLLKECTKIAIRENIEQISIPILRNAYDSKLANIYELNPFEPGFDINEALEKHITVTTRDILPSSALSTNKRGLKL